MIETQHLEEDLDLDLKYLDLGGLDLEVALDYYCHFASEWLPVEEEHLQSVLAPVVCVEVQSMEVLFDHW
jgi:hypothetical protein